MTPVLDDGNIALFHASPLGWYFFGTAIVSTALLLFAVKRQPWALARPAFVVAIALNLLFQWPLMFLARGVEQTLDNPWPLALSLTFFVVMCAGWVLLTPKLTLERGTKIPSTVAKGSLWMPLAVATVLLIIYVATVPLDCTGLWAFISDPLMSQLAREVSIKLVTESVATYAFGALANVALPVLIALFLAKSIEYLRQKSWLKATLLGLAIVLCTALILLPGIKGLLIPAAILAVTGALFWVRRMVPKLITACGLALVFGVLIVGFDTLMEREVQSEPYNFLECSARVGSLAEGEAMLEAIEESGGFGLTGAQVQQLQTNGVLGDIRHQWQPPSDGASVFPGLNRYQAYAAGIGKRIFLVPPQVAVLHYAYVEAYGSPGLAAAPFALRLFGESVDMPSLVFQAYVAPASATNQDSTGTAPTTSVFAWVAYFGFAGVLAVALFIVLFDVAIAWAMRRLDRSLIPVVIGLIFAVVFAMMSSDFLTALFSHGGWLAFAFIGCWLLGARIAARRERARSTSDQMIE